MLAVVSSVLALFAKLWAVLFIWLPIWMAVVLYQAASAASQVCAGRDEAVLVQAADRPRLYFVISGVTTLVGLIIGFAAGLMGALAVLG